MTKTQKGAKGRDDLEKLLHESQKKVADAAAQTVETSRSRKQDKLEGDKKERQVDDAREILTQRGIVQKRFWAILQLTTGGYVVEEAESKRNEIPSVLDIFSKKAVLGKYNPQHVISVEIFKTEKEANIRVREIKKSKKDK